MSIAETSNNVVKKIKGLYQTMEPEEQALFRGLLKQAEIGSTFADSYFKLDKPVQMDLADDMKIRLLISDSNECW